MPTKQAETLMAFEISSAGSVNLEPRYAFMGTNGLLVVWTRRFWNIAQVLKQQLLLQQQSFSSHCGKHTTQCDLETRV